MKKGVTTPPIDVLAALGDLYRRPLNWFLENRDVLNGFRYRNLKSRVRLQDQRQFEAITAKWAEAYFNLRKHLGSGPTPWPSVLGPAETLSPQELAEVVRKKFLEISDVQPVQNMVNVLEGFSAWALEIKVSFGIDGATARQGNEFVVIINPDVANDRVRMNAAHDLAHLLYDECKQELGWTDNDVEKRAYTFASSLLLPDSQLKAAFDGKSFIRLVQFREKFGISLAAMIYRAEKSRIINTSTSRWLWSEMARRGWRESEPGYVWKDRAIGFETMLDCAIQTKMFTWQDAERITGVREFELRERVANVVPGHTVSDVIQSDHLLRFAARKES